MGCSSQPPGSKILHVKGVENMQYHEMFKVCEQAVKKFGTNMQCSVAVEELSELITAICHMLRGREHNIYEEIADTEIMLLQIKIALGCADEVEQCKDKKLKRLMARITKGGEYEQAKG